MRVYKNCEKMKIAVIDGYVNTNLLNKKIQKKSFLCETPLNNNTHGTIVTLKIIDECPEAEVTCIEILNKFNKCKIEYLIKALEYVEKQNFHIVNISLGCETLMAEIKNRLQSICDRILETGTIIFAAKSNEGGECFPTDIKGIVKIGCNPYQEDIYSINLKEKTILFKRNSISLIADGILGIYKGNSFLCPWVVGVFANYLLKNYGNTANTVDEFLLYLIEVRNEFGNKIYGEIDLKGGCKNTYILQGKVPYLEGNMLDYFKPSEVVKYNDINKVYIPKKILEDSLHSLESVLIIDGFLCECQQEKRNIKNFILSLSDYFNKVIMYGNYFNLTERIEVCRETKKRFNSVLF